MTQRKFETSAEAERWLEAMGYWRDGMPSGGWYKGRSLVATVYDNGLVEVYKN